MSDVAWAVRAGAEPTDGAWLPEAPTRPGKPRSYEAMVNGLAFEPLLHFQFGCDKGFQVEVASRQRAPLYVVGIGGCALRWESAAPIALDVGDVVFLPQAGRHRIYNDERAPLQRIDDLIRRGPQRHGNTFDVRLGTGQGPRWSGSFYLRSDLASHPLAASLPPVMVLRQADATEWLPTMTQLVAWMADIRSGGKGVGLAQTMNALLQHLVLMWLSDPARAASLPAVGAQAPHDARLRAGLHAIHTRFAEPWTASSLASLCHMTRTQFTMRFQAQTGQPPMRYLARWRVHLAERMLKEQRMTLQQVADVVGYSSGAILARAYKRERGASPTQHDPPPRDMRL